MEKRKKIKSISYAKWGYIFLIPFFAMYVLTYFIPLISTIYYSFFENYMSGLKQIGPNFVALENYKSILFDSDLPNMLITPCTYGSWDLFLKSRYPCYWQYGLQV